MTAPFKTENKTFRCFLLEKWAVGCIEREKRCFTCPNSCPCSDRKPAIIEKCCALPMAQIWENISAEKPGLYRQPRICDS